MPTTGETRFTALASGEIDVLVAQLDLDLLARRRPEARLSSASTTTTARASWCPTDLGVTSAKELDGATVCIQTGTTTELNLADFFKREQHHLPAGADRRPTPRPTSSSSPAPATPTRPTPRASPRAAPPTRTRTNYVILPEIISKEPLGPVVRQGDNQWADIVRWTLLRAGRGRGVRRDLGQRRGDDGLRRTPEIKPPARRRGRPRRDDRPRRRLGQARDRGAAATTARSSPRNIGEGTPIELARGLNALWTEGGLHVLPAVPLILTDGGAPRSGAALATRDGRRVRRDQPGTSPR